VPLRSQLRASSALDSAYVAKIHHCYGKCLLDAWATALTGAALLVSTCDAVYCTVHVARTTEVNSVCQV
jgi:hypothetical protein